MAWVTTLGGDASQVEYRLSGQCGCDSHAHAHDSAAKDDANADPVVDYRIKNEGRPVERLGGGWADFGEVSGTPLSSDADLESMRQVMAGRDPRTGAQLVEPKMAVDPRAKLPARSLVDAVHAVAEAAHMSPDELLESARLAERFARLERGLLRDGESHRAPVSEMEAIAEAAGIDPGMLWGAEELAEARKHADSRVRVGNRGFDLVLNMPKSMSVLYGLSDEDIAAEIEEIYLDSVRETVGSVEEWAGYAMAGHHGDGRQGARVETSGLIASMTLHRSARPVGDQAGDPHLHAHVMIANMVLGADGQWRALGSGGRDLHRHVAVAGELAKARMRERLSRRFGVEWERDERTGEWEISGIGAKERGVFSSRSRQIHDHVGEGASAAQSRAAATELAQAKNTLGETGKARDLWRRRAESAGIDVDALLGRVLSRERRETRPAAQPSVEELAAIVWDPETGVTAHRKRVDRTHVMTAVAAALPDGLVSASHLDVLTDAVLATGHAVRLPDSGMSFLSNSDRWTSRDILEAEETITLSAERRLDEGAAVVPREQAAAALAAFESERGFALSEEQRRTAERLMSAGHGIDAVRGVAGAGKTTLMSAVYAGWTSEGLHVEGAATAAVAAANLEAESGISSRTVASWVRRIDEGQGLEGVDVLVVDEAAMVDDRSMSVLVRAAEASGTKIVSIGDPAQLRAVGVGGAFAAVHRIVNGETLRENRRQRDSVDREALDSWLNGGRASALGVWGSAGRVHAAARAHEAHDAIAQAWWKDRQGIADPHQAADDVLVLAARNSDVDELNHRIRSLARAGGHLSDTEVAFAQRGGARLRLAAGDVVRVRRNDYRSHRGEGPDVLNGFRGVVAEVDDRRGARVEWRRQGRVESAWIAPEAIARGDLSHGYAMTIAAAQGLTCERAHVYGIGAEAHSLYPAMTRSRGRADLYLAMDALSGAGLDGGGSDADLVRRAINAYARTLRDLDDTMVGDELRPPEPTAPEPAKPEPGLRDAVRARAGSAERPSGIADVLRNRSGKSSKGGSPERPRRGWGPKGPRRGM